MTSASSSGNELGVTRAAAARAAIDSFIVMDVMTAAAASGGDGRPRHPHGGRPARRRPRPSAARDAVKRALDSDALGYTLALGLPELRAKASRRCYKELVRHRSVAGPRRRHQRLVGRIRLDLPRAVRRRRASRCPHPAIPATATSSPPSASTPEIVETGPRNRWMPTPEQIEAAIARRARRPADRKPRQSDRHHAGARAPGGDRRRLPRAQALVHLRRNLSRPHLRHARGHGARSYSDDVVVINSFSKYFSMTGWRVGWMVVPRTAGARRSSGWRRTSTSRRRPWRRSPPSAPSMRSDELRGQQARLRRQPRAAADELPKAGLDRIVPADGAFYLYVDVARLHRRQPRLRQGDAGRDRRRRHARHRLRRRARRRFIRFSYAGSTADMAEAVERLKTWRVLNR